QPAPIIVLVMIDHRAIFGGGADNIAARSCYQHKDLIVENKCDRVAIRSWQKTGSCDFASTAFRNFVNDGGGAPDFDRAVGSAFGDETADGVAFARKFLSAARLFCNRFRGHKPACTVLLKLNDPLRRLRPCDPPRRIVVLRCLRG